MGKFKKLFLPIIVMAVIIFSGFMWMQSEAEKREVEDNRRVLKQIQEKYYSDTELIWRQTELKKAKIRAKMK